MVTSCLAEDPCWKHTGNTPKLHWNHTGNPLEMHWNHTGNAMETQKIYWNYTERRWKHTAITLEALLETYVKCTRNTMETIKMGNTLETHCKCANGIN